MHEQTKERGDIVSSCISGRDTGVDTNDNDQPSVPRQIVHSRDLLNYIEPLEEGLLDYCPWDPSLDEGEEATSEKQETHDLEQDHPSLPFIITNDTEFRKKILAICKKFPDVFKEKLSTEPAKLEPLVLNVDRAKWHVSRNSRTPRIQSERMDGCSKCTHRQDA
jgi:hypothetical protein